MGSGAIDDINSYRPTSFVFFSKFWCNASKGTWHGLHYSIVHPMPSLSEWIPHSWISYKNDWIKISRIDSFGYFLCVNSSTVFVSWTCEFRNIVPWVWKWIVIFSRSFLYIPPKKHLITNFFGQAFIATKIYHQENFLFNTNQHYCLAASTKFSEWRQSS